MKIALAQINPLLGHISYNEKKIKATLKKAEQKKAHLVVFPEMALNGYPTLDLLRHPFFLKKTQQALKNIHQDLPKGMVLLIGAVGPSSSSSLVTNAVFLLKKGQRTRMFLKEYLADYDVFDERRYFKKGSLKSNYFLYPTGLGKNFKLSDKTGFQAHLESAVAEPPHKCIQVLICEEVWQEPQSLGPLHKKPDLILSLNASPFDLSKPEKRLKTTRKWVKHYQCPLVYVNMLAGQEELMFDGASFVLDKAGQVIHQSPSFKEDLSVVDLSKINPSGAHFYPAQKVSALSTSSQWEKTARALKWGLKEFILNNGFTKAHIGLSGGLDSAVTATLACQALGPENVSLLFLPGPWTSALSEKGAFKMAQTLKIPLMVQSIEEMYAFCQQALSQILCPSSLVHKKRELSNITKENIQARLRSLILMAYANQNPKSLLLGTANKSELAWGYGTLYGDLTGGLLPIGDLFKTEVFSLSQYLKIPSFIIKRAPSAELAPHQKDEDQLPPYKTLDPILKKLIEEAQDPKTAFEKKIFQKITQSQFKRRQAPPVLKIKNRSFDRGWRWPLLSPKVFPE